MSLPTDVLLRTTDYQSSMLEDCHNQWAAWIETTPIEPAQSAYMFEPALDAADELHAAPFIAAHGWYRQATAGLRNALEAMSHAAAFAVRNDVQGYTQWRAGALEPKLGNSADLLAADANVAHHEQQLGGAGLFGHNQHGVVREIYAHLCRYAHSHAGHANADIWQSNGPVWVGRGFTQFWVDFCDTVGLCHVLLKIGYPGAVLPESARPLFGAFSERWNNLGLATEAIYDELKGLAREKRIVAIGEVGLDFHYDHSPRDVQREVFRKQVRLARDVGLPVIIHAREADDMTAALLEDEGAGETGGVIHCFTGGKELARRALALGFYVSFSGIVAFPRAETIQEVARTAPLDRILVETDAPFLAPPPHRGKRNEPAFVVEVARKVAALRGVAVEAVGAASAANFRALFRPAED